MIVVRWKWILSFKLNTRNYIPSIPTMFHSNYNSIINEGHRVRRMRRTQLSGQKINIHKKKSRYIYHESSNSSRRVKLSNSLPKTERSVKSIYKYKKIGNSNTNQIPNQYYEEEKKQNPRKDIESFYRSTKKTKNQKQKTHQISQQSSEYQMNGSSSRQQSMNQLASNHQKLPQSQIQSYKKEAFRQKTLHKKVKSISIKQEAENYQAYLSKFGQKSSHPSEKGQQKQSNSPYAENSYEIFKPVKKEKKKNNTGKILGENKQSKLSKNLKSKRSQKFKTKNSFYQSVSQNQSKPSVSNILGKQIDQIQKISNFSSQLNKSSGSSIQTSNNFNYLTAKLTSVLNQNKNFDSKKNQKSIVELKNSSFKKGIKQSNLNSDYIQEKIGSEKVLPIMSRETSKRQSLSYQQRSIQNSIDQVVQRIQIHDYIITLLSSFAEQTKQFYKNKNKSWEKLCFSLERKNFYERSKMIKALKGGKNIFQLSSIEIPSYILNNFLNSEQILSIITQLEETNKRFFIQLDKKYKEIKKKHKQNNLIKLETPIDNFSKYIIKQLHQQLEQLYPYLEQEKVLEDQLEIYQDRIIQVMEKMFLLYEFEGKKIKKLEFSEEIQDFYEYYDNNYPNLLCVIEYFQNLQ